MENIQLNEYMFYDHPDVLLKIKKFSKKINSCVLLPFWLSRSQILTAPERLPDANKFSSFENLNAVIAFVWHCDD